MKLSKKQLKIISIVEDYPEGITLAEIAYVLDEDIVILSKRVNRLIAVGKVRKEENRYLIASGE